MKKIRFLWAMLLMGVLSGCSQNEWSEEVQNPNNAIQFGVSAGKQTRAPVVDNANISQKPFGLYAYYTGQDSWNTYSTATNTAYTPNFMNNQLVGYNSTSGAWEYTPLKYWPNTSGDKLSFFAYWPYSSSSSVEVNAAAAGSLPAITFTQSTDPTQMVDFIVAHKLDMLKQTGVVVLPFEHVLTRLNFSAKIDHGIGAASETTVYVTGLKIWGGTTSSALYEKATYQLDATSGTWKYDTGTKVSDAIDVSPIFAPQGTADPANKWLAANTGKSVPLAKDGKLTSLLEKDEYAFLIPPHGKDGVKTENDILVELAYSIVTEDASLTDTGGYSETTTSATISLPEGILKEGKAYNICFTIGLSEVKLSATVWDWEEEEKVDVPSSIIAEADGGTATAITKAWQSLNTGAKDLDADVNYFFIKIPAGAPADGLDLSEANGIYNFDEGDRVELQYNDLGIIQGELKLPDGWVWDKASNGANVLYKNSPKGYYLSDGENIEPDDNGYIMILDKDVTKEQLDALATKYLGATITNRAVSTPIRLTMHYLEVLPDKAFKDCNKLASLFLPRLKELGSNTFEGCTVLEELKMSTVNELEKAGTNWFGEQKNFVNEDLTVIIGQCAETSGITVDTEEGKITVSGETYTFQEDNVSCPGLDYEAGVSDGGMSAGGAEWGNGEDITISNNKSTNP